MPFGLADGTASEDTDTSLLEDNHHVSKGWVRFIFLRRLLAKEEWREKG